MTTAVATYDAQRKADKRASDRDLKIPKVKDPKRRAACEADDCEWLRVYVPSVFRFPFTSDQRLMIEEIGHCLEFGLFKCFAAPRHDGKTSVARYLSAKYSLQKVERNGLLVPRVPLTLLINATAKKSGDSLDAIKQKLRSRPGTPIFDDYPLECTVARYVGPAPARANNVTANGKPLFVEWGAEHIILPSWDDEGGMSGMLAALGITSNDIQGFNLYDVRPRFVLLDDLDDRDSLASKDGGAVAKKIETNVDENVAGLGGPGEPFGAVMLCTIPSRRSVAFKYSDATQKASWSGVRLRKIKEWPDRKDLWDEYIRLRKEGKSRFDESGRPLDKYGREAHQFYVANWEAMNAGVGVSNPYDFIDRPSDDGSPAQLSTIQNCYDYIADNGTESFLTEYQNDPPEDSGLVESGITPKLIQKQLSGVPKLIIPPGCTVLTHGCDVGKTKGFHWVVRAWKPDGTRYTIDYGTMDVLGAKYGSDEGLERALYNAVLRRMDEFRTAGYAFADGSTIRETLSLFDARWKTDTIIKAVAACGLGVKAVIGIGQSAGCIRGKFRDVIQNQPNRRKCGTTGAYEELHTGDYGKVWVVHCDTDRWKAFEHDGWMTATDRPGSSFLYGVDRGTPDRLSADERAHDIYASHICAEIEVEVENLVRKWIQRGKQNDYLDASYISDVAAGMKGIRVVGTATPTRTEPKDRPTARELAGKR